MRMLLIISLFFVLSVLYQNVELFPAIEVALIKDGTWFIFLFIAPALLLASLILDGVVHYLDSRGSSLKGGKLHKLSGKFRVLGYLYSGCILANFSYQIVHFSGFTTLACLIIFYICVLLGLIVEHTHHCKKERGLTCATKHKT